MRILLVCEGDAGMYDSWSGVTRSLLTHLRAAGHTVHTADVDLYGIARAIVVARSASTSRRRWSTLYHLGALGFRARSDRFAAFVREQGCDADIVLQIGATFEPPAGLNVPVALFCDSNIDLSRSGASGFSEASVLSSEEIRAVHARETGVYEQASIIFTMSEMVRRSFIADFGLPADRLVTIRCGPNVDPSAIEISVPQDVPESTILFVGRDPVRKGADLMLRAFRQVRERMPRARLVMVGPPRGMAVPDGVEVMGFLDRDTSKGRSAMHAAYAASHVFCLPTRFDPFGTSFVEAMAYGLPCVGPDAWAVPEIIDHGRTGLLVPPEDPAAIAEALIAILSDDETRNRMGRAARERALSQFAWPVLVARMLDSMQQVVDDRARSASGGESSRA